MFEKRRVTGESGSFAELKILNTVQIIQRVAQIPKPSNEAEEEPDLTALPILSRRQAMSSASCKTGHGGGEAVQAAGKQR